MAKKKTTKDLISELESYQSGVATPEQIGLPDFGDDARGRELQEATMTYFANNPIAVTPKEQRLAEVIAAMDSGTGYRDDTTGAMSAGFGSSKYDVEYSPFVNLDEIRAENQSGGRRVLFGLFNGGVTAGATFVNSTLGLLNGLFNGVANIGGDPDTGFWEGFVNNKTSETMQDIMEWGKQVAPRYLTEEQKSDAYQKHWYYPSHIFSSNFLADFLDNFGFTVGSIGAGALVGKVANSAWHRKTADKFIKSIAKAAKGDKEADEFLKNVKKAIDEGRVQSINDARFQPELERLAKKIVWEDILTQTTTGALAAAGEGIAEGLMAKREFLDDFKAQAQQDYENRYDEIENEVLSSGNGDWVNTVNVYGRDVPFLTQEGQAEVGRRRQEESLAYAKRLQEADIEGDNIAANTLIMNLPILTANNVFMYARLLRGGWKRARSISGTAKKQGVKGGIDMANENGAVKIKGAFKPIREKATLPAWQKAAGVMVSEAGEELSQGVASTASKNMARDRISEYNDAGYDLDARRSMAGYIWDAAKEYLGDVKNWQEGFMGALTGALGIPGKRWNGGIKGAIRDAREEVSASKAAANKLNELVNSEAFQKRWTDFIRHLKYDNDMSAAMANDDEYTWRNASQKQLVSDVIAFAQAGRLNELVNLVDAMGDLSEKDAESIKAVADWAGDMEAPDIIKEVKNKANEVKDVIKEYKEVYDAINARSPQGISDEFMNELVFTSMNIREFEKRFINMLSEVLDGTSEHPGIRYTVLENAKPEEKEKYEEIFAGIERRLGHLNASGLSYDRNANQKEIVDALINSIKDVSRISAVKKAISQDKVLNEKFNHLINVAEDRQAYYKKLATLQQSDGQRKLLDNMETQEKIDKKLENKYNEKKANEYIQKLENANSPKEYLEAMIAINDPDIESMAVDKIENNPKLKKFRDDIQDASDFVGELKNEVQKRSGFSENPNTVTAMNELAKRIGEYNANDKINGEANSQNILDALNNYPDAPSVAAAVAQTLLDEAVLDNAETAKALEEMLREMLGNIIKSNAYGEIKSNPAKEEKDSQELTEEEKELDTVSDISNKINEATSLNDPTLSDILKNDFSKYPELSDSDKQRLSILARDKKQKLQKEDGMAVTEEKVKGHEQNTKTEEALPERMPETSAQHKVFVQRETQAARGMDDPIYDLNELSATGTVEVMKYNKDGVKATTEWLKNHNVQKVLDSGMIYELYDYYARQGKKLPIYLIANPHIAANNPFAVHTDSEYAKDFGYTRSNVLLALDIDELRKDKGAAAILKKFQGNNVFSEGDMLDIENSKYQVVGMLWNPTPDDLKKKPESEQAAYGTMRDMEWKTLEVPAMKSIYGKYSADLKKNPTAFGPDGKWYVADMSHGQARLYTTLNYITPGWNQLNNGENKNSDQKRLSESMKDYIKQGKDYQFLIRTKDRDVCTDPNMALPPAIDAPIGSLWMATRRADGSIAWTYITIARTGEVDFEAIKDTAIMSDIRAAMKTIFAPANPNASKEAHDNDFKNRLDACRDLENIFYLGSGNHIEIVFDGGSPVAYIGDANRNKPCRSQEEMLAAFKEKNYRFQVSTEMITSGINAFNKLKNAGILSSEMQSFTRAGSMIGVNFIDHSNPNGSVPIESGMSVSVGESIGKGVKEIAPGTVSDIRIGAEGYQLNPDGTVQEMSNGKSVTDGTIVAQAKAIAEVVNLLKTNQIDKYSGSRWVIDKEGQYTELYEQDVNGVKVHMHREGKNGAVMPVIYDDMWDRWLSQAEKKESQNANDIDAILKQKTEPKKEQVHEEPNRRRRKTRESLSSESLSKDDSSKTVQESEKKDKKDESRIDCG